MNKRSNALRQKRSAHIGAKTVEINMSDDGRFATCHNFTDNPLAFFKFHHLEALRGKSMTDTRDDLGLFVIPGEDNTAICIEHVHSYIYKRLKYLIQAYVAKDPFICLIERLNFLIPFFPCAGSLPHEMFQLAVAILHGLGAQSD